MGKRGPKGAIDIVQLVRMREQEKKSWAEIGEAFGVSGQRAGKAYRQYLADASSYTTETDLHKEMKGWVGSLAHEAGIGYDLEVPPLSPSHGNERVDVLLSDGRVVECLGQKSLREENGKTIPSRVQMLLERGHPAIAYVIRNDWNMKTKARAKLFQSGATIISYEDEDALKQFLSGVETVSPPAPEPRKPSPAPKKGGGNTPIASELEGRVKELEEQLGTSPGMVDAHNRLNAINRLQLEMFERLDALEAGQAPTDQSHPTDAVDIIRAMFDYLGPHDAWRELGDIERQTVYGWHDRDRIPGWVHDIGWD